MNGGMLTVSNNEFGKLEILVEDGKELFPATECAKMLGYSQPNSAIRTHCLGCAKRTVSDARGHKQIVNYIYEATCTALSSVPVCPPRRSLRSGCLTRFCLKSAAPAATAQSRTQSCRTSGLGAGASSLTRR